MKKYLLTLLVVWISFIWFSNANIITTSCNGYRSPCSINDYTYKIWNDVYSCFRVSDNIEKVVLTSTCNGFFDYSFWDDWHWNESCLDSFTFTNKSVVCVNSDDWTFSFNFVAKPLVSWGSSNFTPVLTSISSSISEFIPYIVYIGLWILGALIWFYAIRWFINWLRKKIFSSFK